MDKVIVLAPLLIVYNLHNLFVLQEYVIMLVTSTREIGVCLLSYFNNSIDIIHFVKHSTLTIISILGDVLARNICAFLDPSLPRAYCGSSKALIFIAVISLVLQLCWGSVWSWICNSFVYSSKL